jgi:hypothetical protein
MKRNYLIIEFVLLLLICSTVLQAQTEQPKLDQLEFLKKAIGTWEYKISQDSTYTFHMELYGDKGGIGWAKVTVKDKIIMEGQILFSYSKELDKIILAFLVKGKEIALTVRWATAINRYTRVGYKYVANPESAPLRYEVEYTNPDTFVEDIFINNKKTATKTWTRLKD